MLKNRFRVLFPAILFVLAISLSAGVARVQRTNAQPSPDPSCSLSGPCLEWQNTSFGTAIEGIAGSGIGIFGTSTGSYGIKGVSSSSDGVYGGSSSSSGVVGSSTGSDGIFGQTFYTATSGATGKAGVLGLDATTTGRFDSGIEGLSTNGVGVRAFSTTNDAVYATSASFDSIHSVTTNNSKVSKLGRSGVLGQDTSKDGGRLNAGIAGTSINGIGVSGKSSFVGVNAVGGNGIWPALSIVGDSNKGPLILACPTTDPCDVKDFVFSVSDAGDGNFQGGLDVAHTILTTEVEAANGVLFNGVAVGGVGIVGTNNINIQGQYLISGGCVLGCSASSATSAGRAVSTYSAQTTSPTIEDYGEAQLVSGQVYVHLDAAFANVVDQRKSYLVFITPEGDNRGLYVTQKSSRGFVVRESQGGHSTIAFSYRIVAKPYGNDRPRLPMVTVPARNTLAQFHAQ